MSSERQVEPILKFTWKEFIATITSVLVLVLIGYFFKDLIYGEVVISDVSITLAITSLFAFVYLLMLFIKFGKEGKKMADEQKRKNNQVFDKGVITIKDDDSFPPVILPEEKKS